MPLGLEVSAAPALIDPATGAQVRFDELPGLAEELDDVLGDERSLVFLLCRNDLFTVGAYLAAQMAGHVVALLDAGAHGQATDTLLTAYRPDWVAGPPGSGKRLSDAGAQVRSIVEWRSGEWVRLDHGSAPTELHPDLALLLSTSGTTGTRRFVRLSRRNLDSNSAAIASYLALGPGDVAITSLPLHYAFGLSILNSHLRAGAATVISAASVMQDALWATVRRYGCTSLAGVPYTYGLLERVAFRDMALPSLTSMLVAGGALDRTLTMRYLEHMRRRAGRFIVMYGQTEATARMAYVPPDMLQAKLGSAGIAIPGGRLSVQPGRTTSEAPRIGPPRGEVVYEGPNVMMGYATSADDLRLGDELTGILHTGDLGYLDADGYLFLTGRIKRIAKVFGIRVNLDEVELILREHGPAAVVEDGGCIWGFCGFGGGEELERVRRRVAGELRLHPTALNLRRVAEIPQSSTGKIDYAALHRLTRGR
jgi:acyl-CoA synthetase (AMP-forming)/AMP-acid ligase II